MTGFGTADIRPPFLALPSRVCYENTEPLANRFTSGARQDSSARPAAAKMAQCSCARTCLPHRCSVMAEQKSPGAGLTGELLRFGPHAGAHRVAVRAGVSVLVPLLVLWATGHTNWSIYAAFGAFTSLYGRTQVHLTRMQMQSTVAVLLVLSATTGVLVGSSPHRAWIAVAVSTFLAAFGSVVSDAQGWHPPGPLFLIFAFAACASIPSVPADVGVAAGVCTASAVFAIAIGNAGALWRVTSKRAEPTTVRATNFAGAAKRHALRCGLGVLVAGSLTTAIGIGHPYWAMVSALVPMAARTFRVQLVRGVHRIIGTGLGLLTTALLLSLQLHGLALIAVIAALQVGAELLVGRNYAVALITVTPLALLMVHMLAPIPAGTLLFDRGVETVIGAVTGVLIGYLTRPRVAAPQPA